MYYRLLTHSHHTVACPRQCSPRRQLVRFQNQQMRPLACPNQASFSAIRHSGLRIFSVGWGLSEITLKTRFGPSVIDRFTRRQKTGNTLENGRNWNMLARYHTGQRVELVEHECTLVLGLSHSSWKLNKPKTYKELADVPYNCSTYLTVPSPGSYKKKRETIPWVCIDW